MSINILCDQSMGFRNGEKDKYGNDIAIVTKVGFNSVPDWVADTAFYKAGVKSNIIHVASKSNDEAAVKASEEAAALRKQVKELQEQLDVQKEASATKQDAKSDTDTKDTSKTTAKK